MPLNVLTNTIRGITLAVLSDGCTDKTVSIGSILKAVSSLIAVRLDTARAECITAGASEGELAALDAEIVVIRGYAGELATTSEELIVEGE